MRNSKDALLDFFNTSIWEDIRSIVAEKRVEYINILLNEAASDIELRKAQKAISVLDELLDISEYIEEHYEEIEEEERMEEDARE